MNQFVTSLLGTIAALFVIIVGARFLGPIPLSISQTTTNKQSAFDVTGTGEVTTDPDRALVSLGVQFTDDTVTKVQEKGNKTMKMVTDDFGKLGIAKADIKTNNYSLYPAYDYRSGTQKITGYNLNISLQVTIKDFTKINDVMDTATRDGVNQVGGVSFTLSDDKKKTIENQAREQAIARAKEKADSLARIAGMRLGKIVNISENTNGFPRPIPMMAKEAIAPVGLGGGTDVQPGSTTFSMMVTLSYETL